MKKIRIVFDELPVNVPDSFIGVEDETGKSLALGELVIGPLGAYTVLEFDDFREENAILKKQLEKQKKSTRRKK